MTEKNFDAIGRYNEGEREAREHAAARNRTLAAIEDLARAAGSDSTIHVAKTLNAHALRELCNKAIEQHEALLQSLALANRAAQQARRPPLELGGQRADS